MAGDMPVVSNNSFFEMALYPPDSSIYFSNKSFCFFARPIMFSASFVLFMYVGFIAMKSVNFGL